MKSATHPTSPPNKPSAGGADEPTGSAGSPHQPAGSAGSPHEPAGSAGDMLFGMGGKLLYAATRVALPPLALAHMGLAEYGLWAACFVLVGYLGMAASGFTLVYLRGTAHHHAAGNTAAIGRLLSTGMLAMAGLACLLLLLLWALLPLLLALFKVPADQHAVARWLWLGASGVFLVDMSLGAFANVLHAIGRVRQEQQVWMLAFVLEALLIVGFLQAGAGVLGLLAAFALRYLFSATANAWLAWRALPGLRLSWRHFDPALLRTFFGFGAGMQLAGLLASALHSADRVVAGALLGPQATALVDMAAKLPTTAAAVASSASGVAVSASARHDARGQHGAVQQVYRDASRITVAGLALALPFLAAAAPLLSLAWLGAGGAHAEVAELMPWLAAALYAHLLTGPATAVSRGRGRLQADFSYSGLRAVALAVALLACTWRGGTGLQAVVQALAAAQMLAAGTFVLLAHRRLCGGWHSLLASVIAPTLGAWALAQGLHLLLVQRGPAAPDRWQALAALVIAGALWLPLTATMLGALLLRKSEAAQLSRRLLQPLNWRRA